MPKSEASQSSGLYIDVDNLQNDAQNLIGSLVEDWPDRVPQLSKIVLYVRADLVALWEMWSLTLALNAEVDVKGVQHFSMQGSKNSADIAIAVDAVTDLVRSRISHVAVFSDDSDFMALFAKVKAEAKQTRKASNRAPFLWILTDRPGTKTPYIRQFFPSEYLHVVQMPSQSQVPQPSTPPAPPVVKSNKPAKVVAPDELMTDELVPDELIPDQFIAEAILKEVPVGPFKSAECHQIVKQRFPQSPAAKQTGAAFGVYIANNIWPLLEARGVASTGTKPRKYEMTQAAKFSVIE